MTSSGFNDIHSSLNGATTAYIGSHYEYSLSSSTAKKYYYAGSSRIAMCDDTSSLHWLISDPLGSSMKSVKASDSTTSDRRCRAWGEARNQKPERSSRPFGFFDW
ncbi:MAG: hypothetical protein JXB15_05355 [Anaerolineales bacterium]|nr:hypothetical protein [Anaerolineales bacterium]